MGNRVFVTIRHNSKTERRYFHWNGSLDTWCPLVAGLFESKDPSPSKLFERLSESGIRSSQESWIDDNSLEENGHYFIDLDNKIFRVKTEDGNFLIHDCRREFDNFINTKILAESREEVREVYWREFYRIGLGTIESEDQNEK